MKRSDIPTKDVLLACHQFHAEKGKSGLELLIDKFNAPEKVVYAAMSREDNKGFIDYGVSLRTAWVTKEGYDFLAEIGIKLKNNWRDMKNNEQEIIDQLNEELRKSKRALFALILSLVFQLIAIIVIWTQYGWELAAAILLLIWSEGIFNHYRLTK